MNERYQETLPLASEHGHVQPLQCCLVDVWVPHVWRIPKGQNAVAQNLSYHSLKGPGCQLQWKKGGQATLQMNQMNLECKNKFSFHKLSHPFTKTNCDSMNPPILAVISIENSR